MTKCFARFKQSVSFIIGLLIGLSLVVTAFAGTNADSTAWRIIFVIGAPAILLLGFALQVLVSAERRRRHVIRAEHEAVSN